MHNMAKLSAAARTRVRDRLRERPKRPILESTAGAVCGSKLQGIQTLVQEFAAVIGVDAEYLRGSDRLGEILRVDLLELPIDARVTMSKVGLQDSINPFAFALLDFVERRLQYDPSRLRNAAFSPPPKNEEEWINRILDLTVADLLDALA